MVREKYREDPETNEYAKQLVRERNEVMEELKVLAQQAGDLARKFPRLTREDPYTAVEDQLLTLAASFSFAAQTYSPSDPENSIYIGNLSEAHGERLAARRLKRAEA